MSEAQKRAQKKYDKKTKVVSIKYTPADMQEYEKLKQYLAQTNQSVNGFIKRLINDYFDVKKMKSSEEEKQNVSKCSKEEEKRWIFKEYQPYSYIEIEYFQFLKEHFGEDILDEILREYYELIDYEIDYNIVDVYGENFENWVEDLKDRIEQGERILGTKEEIRRKLIDDMCKYL